MEAGGDVPLLDLAAVAFDAAEDMLEGVVADAVEVVSSRPGEFSAVFLDLLTPGKDGLEALREIRTIAKDLPVFVTSFTAAPGSVVEAMRCGATDFIVKPVTHKDLREHMLQVAAPAPMTAVAAEPGEGASDKFWGNSRSMREIQATVRRISESDAPILIEGETGVGKEVLAREIHAHSRRAGRQFLKLNCAALPSELVESELFGYERGAFTGAFQRKSGMFEQADRGTILLDEIGDMDYKLQAKLLQVLQDREFQRLGGKETVRVDVRVIAATHCDFHAAIRDGSFREDLYYRLNVINVRIPPLRERKHDILPLAHRFLAKHGANGPMPVLTPALQQAMVQYDWPGNVRELENLIRRFLVFGDAAEVVRELGIRNLRVTENAAGSRAVVSMRSTGVARKAMAAAAGAGAGNGFVDFDEPAAPAAVPEQDGRPSVLKEVARAKEDAEAAAILQVLESTHWNRKRAAQVLNIDYKALLYKMKKLSIGTGNHVS